MKLPHSWIREVINLNESAHQIALRLTAAGLEVDSIAPLSLAFEKIVIGEVTGTEKHPNAEKLCIATVTDGVNSYQVVCGAPNCRKGIKTAFAMIGASLKSDDESLFKIKKSSLRGVESYGMLCSEKELGLGEESSGIMEFDAHLPVGADLAEIYGDTIFDISLTPNLGHCASVLGVARELHAATGVPLSLPLISLEENVSDPVENLMAVEVKSSEKCPRYACRLIRNVKVAPSPSWLQKRLLACDLRPVNNIVDITNYVLLEMGHPLHAFDYNLIEGNKISVRPAKEGESLVTLDGKVRSLTPDDLVIADSKNILAVAGVMGGQNSEVNENTVDVLLESAFFESKSVRKTSKRLALQTEASKRFERGSDPNNVLKALDRAAMLMHQIANGSVCSGVIDEKEKDFSGKVITCRLARINQLLGLKLGVSEVEAIFQRLEMGYDWDGQDSFLVRPPTYRVDVNEEVDLIEEVARIYGFDNILKKTPKFTSSNLPHAPIYLFEQEMRRQLLTEGLQEFVTCDLIGPSLLNVIQEELMPEEAVIRVLNPTSIEQSILRTSLLPGLLQVAKYNYDHQRHHINGFEIGRIHFRDEGHYKEQSVAAILLTGENQPSFWESEQRAYDFYDLKGVVENICHEFRIGPVSFKNNGMKIFHPGRQASIYIDSQEVGSMGEVHPAILRRLDVPQRIYFAEIDLHQLFKKRKTDLKFQEMPIFPSSSRDLTLTLEQEIPIQEVLKAVHSIPSRILESVSVIGLYTSEKLGKNKKNVTFHFVYRDRKKTIAQEAVDAEHARVTSQLHLLGGKTCDPSFQ